MNSLLLPLALVAAATVSVPEEKKSRDDVMREWEETVQQYVKPLPKGDAGLRDQIMSQSAESSGAKKPEAFQSGIVRPKLPTAAEKGMPKGSKPRAFGDQVYWIVPLSAKEPANAVAVR